MSLHAKLKQIQSNLLRAPQAQKGKAVMDSISQICTAFHEAGYVHIPHAEIVERWEHGKKPEVIMVNGNVVMTGQEWYEHFDRELQSLISRGDGETWMGWGCGEVRNAAKKAAGINDR